MTGRRLPDGDYAQAERGSYWRDPRNGLWYCVTPNGRMGNLGGHTVVEHEDGTITVSPSILVDQPSHRAWHGYLERGVWREV